MEEYKNYLNPFQYKYIYEVCRRLGAYVDDLEKGSNKETIIIFKSLIDALHEIKELKRILKDNNIENIDNKNIDKGYKEKKHKDKLLVTDDPKLIERAYKRYSDILVYNAYKPLLEIDEQSDIKIPNKNIHEIIECTPYGTINKFLYNKNPKIKRTVVYDYCRENDINLGLFLYKFKLNCESLYNKYIEEENIRIKNLNINKELFSTLDIALNYYASGLYYDRTYIYVKLSEYNSPTYNNLEEYIKGFINVLLYSKLNLLKNLKYKKFGEKFKSTNVKYKKMNKEFSPKAIFAFNNYAYFKGCENKTVDEYLYELYKNHPFEFENALRDLFIDRDVFLNVLDLPVRKSVELPKNISIENNYIIEDEINPLIKKASEIKVGVFNSTSSIDIFEYGEKELKNINSIIDQIGSYATGVNGELIISEAINSAIPKLSIIDRLNSKSIAKKMEDNFDNTKFSLNSMENTLKDQMKVYEALVNAYDMKLELIKQIEEQVDLTIKNVQEEGLVKTSLENKKHNIDLIRVSTEMLKEQVFTLASNHMVSLNMLYRTKETFITAIEGQSLINNGIAAEKNALKNIKIIVELYDAALNNDFNKAFSMLGTLKNNGLDFNSSCQLEANLLNIQSLFDSENANVVTTSYGAPLQKTVPPMSTRKNACEELGEVNQELFNNENIELSKIHVRG